MDRISKGVVCVTLAALASCQPVLTPPDANPDEIVAVRLDPAGPFGVLLGVTIQVRLTAQTRAGATIPVPSGVQFSSTNPSVAAIDGGGLLTAVGLGQAFVVGQLTTPSGTLADSADVGVVCTAELTQRYEPATKTLAVGESFTPTVALTTCGGQIALTDPVTWRPVDTLVAAVDASGRVVTGRAPGATQIRAVTAQYGTLSGIPLTVTP